MDRTIEVTTVRASTSRWWPMSARPGLTDPQRRWQRQHRLWIGRSRSRQSGPVRRAGGRCRR
ncbi:hypothetical protein C7E18_24205, partial [Stenotrophomonas maltophilia]